MRNGFSINRGEAGTLLLDIEMKSLSFSEAEELINTSKYGHPAHTATIHRIARRFYRDRLKEIAFIETARQAEVARFAALPPEKQTAEEGYAADYRQVCTETNKKNKRHKARRQLETKWGFPKGSNGRWE